MILCLYSGVRKMAAWSDLPKAGSELGFVGIFEQSVAMIECVQSSSWTGYMLMKVRHDLLEVGFVKVPGDDEGSVRMFVVISAEHIVEIGQSQASVCLWWNVDNSNDD